MQGKLERSQRAVKEFLEAANPQDEFFLLQFSEQSDLTVDFTHSTEEILNSLASARAKGNTALLDAIYLALQRIRFGKNSRKALLIISDGGENNSRYTEHEVKDLAQETDAQMFAVGIYRRVPFEPERREAFNGRTLMTRIVEITGGFQYPVQNVNELPGIVASISNIVRSQYVLAYRSTNQARDGKYRRVRVQVVQPIGRPPVRAYWRSGYYAPNSIH